MVIHLHLLITGGAMQFGFVIGLDTLFADIAVGGVVLAQAGLVQALEIAVVDLRHIAQHVRQLAP